MDGIHIGVQIKPIDPAGFHIQCWAIQENSCRMLLIICDHVACAMTSIICALVSANQRTSMLHASYVATIHSFDTHLR